MRLRQFFRRALAYILVNMIYVVRALSRESNVSPCPCVYARVCVCVYKHIYTHVYTACAVPRRDRFSRVFPGKYLENSVKIGRTYVCGKSLQRDVFRKGARDHCEDSRNAYRRDALQDVGRSAWKRETWPRAVREKAIQCNTRGPRAEVRGRGFTAAPRRQ